MDKFRPFDIVRTKEGKIGWIYTTQAGVLAAVKWFEPESDLRNAWWEREELEVLTNIAADIADQIAQSPMCPYPDQGKYLLGKKD